MTPAGITLAATLLASAGAPGVGAPPETAAPGNADAARSEAARGEALFTEGRLDEASAAYERAYALDPFAPFLFARARVEQEAGHCEAAIELYREFIATSPPEGDVDRANMEIGRCVSESSAAGLSAPAVPPAVIAEPESRRGDTPRRTAPSRDKWRRDAAGGALLSVGLFTLAAGLGLFLAGDVTDRRAEQAHTTDDFRRMIGRARALKGTGITGLSLGSALIIGAIARYATVARRARRARAREASSAVSRRW